MYKGFIKKCVDFRKILSLVRHLEVISKEKCVKKYM